MRDTLASSKQQNRELREQTGRAESLHTENRAENYGYIPRLRLQPQPLLQWQPPRQVMAMGTGQRQRTPAPPGVRRTTMDHPKWKCFNYLIKDSTHDCATKSGRMRNVPRQQPPFQHLTIAHIIAPLQGSTQKIVAQDRLAAMMTEQYDDRAI